MRLLAVTNIYPTPDAPASGTFVEQQIAGLRGAGVDVAVFFVDRARRGVGIYAAAGPLVKEAVRRLEPDLVHIMYGGVLADLVTRAVDDRPLVVSFCGTDLLGQRVCGPVRKLMSTVGVFASHRAARRASGIIVKSRNLLEALPAPVDRTRVRVIPNGVNLQRFRPLHRGRCQTQLGWRSDRFHVLFPANSGDPVKRFGLASTAVAMAARTGLHPEVHQLRGVNHRDVPVWLNASHVLLLTSVQEGSPNIVKEALACRIPIVAVDVGDVRERIQGLQGCYLAKPDAVDLAAGLRAAFDGPRRILGHTGIDEMSLGRISMRISEFYTDILNYQRSLPPAAMCTA